jgi:hypothetical protein
MVGSVILGVATIIEGQKGVEFSPFCPWFLWDKKPCVGEVIFLDLGAA